MNLTLPTSEKVNNNKFGLVSLDIYSALDYGLWIGYLKCSHYSKVKQPTKFYFYRTFKETTLNCTLTRQRCIVKHLCYFSFSVIGPE